MIEKDKMFTGGFTQIENKCFNWLNVPENFIILQEKENISDGLD